MTTIPNHDGRVGDDEMMRRYHRAEQLQQGLFSQKVAANTTLVPHWIGTSDVFWYTREFVGHGKEFRLVDAARRTNTLAFDHEALAAALQAAKGVQVEADDLPITALAFTFEPLTICFEAFGDRWWFDAAANSCTLTDRRDPNWLVSPDGQRALFLRDHNLWLRDLATGNERPLTSDGVANNAYGTTPTAWGVAQGGLPDAVWSPDSRHVLTLRMDTRQVETAPLVQFAPPGGGRPRILQSDRPFALPGDRHIDAFGILAINTVDGTRRDADHPAVPVYRNALGYFRHGHGWWSADSRRAFFIDIERGGDHRARLVAFDTVNGATKTIIDEASPDVCFKLRLDSRVPIHARALGGHAEVLWFSERSGWGHLYRHDAVDGRLLNAVTSGDWLVRDVHYFDDARRALLIQTAGRDKSRNPYYRDLSWVNVDTGDIQTILSGDHDHVVFDCATELGANLGLSRDVSGAKGVSPTGRYIVSTRSRVDTPPQSLLLTADGQIVMGLEQADVSGLPDGWHWPEPISAKGGDGVTDVHGVVYRPPHYDRSKTYPVLDMSMGLQEGGPFPAGSFTNNALAGLPYFTGASLAALGFIVVDIYTRGTSNRDRAFYRHRDVESPLGAAVADRVAVLKALAASDPSMDMDRVGAGGVVSTSTALTALLGAPELYKVGVTNGAAFDMRLAPAFVGEAYADLPAAQPEYTTAADFADRLRGKLLVMHGMMNPTASVAMAFQLIDALQKANRTFDMLVLPNDGYGMSSYALRRCWDYLTEHLLGATPPADYCLTTGMDLIAEHFAKKAEEVSRPDNRQASHD